MELASGKKIYFLSDFHLGAPNEFESRKREDRLVRFLAHAKQDAAAFFIVGDIFDFWFEYKTVVPNGFLRLFGILAQIADAGIPIHIFKGNHDLWMNDYLAKELNAQLYFDPVCQWLFRWLHPDLGIQLANYFSAKSRAKTGTADEQFLGEDKEWLIIYCKQKVKELPVDFFVFGHRHFAIDFKLTEKSRYINLGDWIRLNTYGVFDGTVMELKEWKD